MRRYIHIYVLLFLVSGSFCASSQNQIKIDSLQLVLSGKVQDTVRVQALLSLSLQYQGFDTDKAFDYGNKALKLSQTINYPKGIGDAHNNLGDLFWYKNDFASSADHYMQALHIFEKLGQLPYMASCYRNLGWVYHNKGNLKTAMEYHRKALSMNLALKRKNEISQNYNDIGIIFINTKLYDSAVIALDKSMKLQKELGNKEGLVSSYGNQAIAYDDMNMPEKAMECMVLAVKLAEETGVKQHITATYCNLGSFYAKNKRYDEAIVMLEKSLKCAREINFLASIKDIYRNLAAVHASKKDFAKSYAYQEMLVKLKDTIYNNNNSRQVNEMTAKYESEKKEILISSLEKDKKLLDEKFEQERNFKIYLSIFCLLIAGSAFMLYRGNLQKKKANVALSHAYKEIEVKNKDITDSITYSKRIQEATLPPKELKHKLFPDAFVLFKPKDIVSGDFYWYAEKDGKRLIAACDCTGHGVPGALMSMIGNNIINQIVNEKGITSPAEILNQLHLEIRKSLKQEEHEENRDGMDIALVVFENEHLLRFAGAQRPLWIIRKEGQDVEEIKGNKFSIGGLQTEEDRKFTEHQITLAAGDSVYLFSDGYVDQFGGESGKKFMTKNLRQLLLNIHKEPMASQEKHVEQVFIKHQGDTEQMDDVLVIGIKTR